LRRQRPVRDAVPVPVPESPPVGASEQTSVIWANWRNWEIFVDTLPSDGDNKKGDLRSPRPQSFPSREPPACARSRYQQVSPLPSRCAGSAVGGLPRQAGIAACLRRR
jgi:hypothetical protein